MRSFYTLLIAATLAVSGCSKTTTQSPEASSSTTPNTILTSSSSNNPAVALLLTTATQNVGAGSCVPLSVTSVNFLQSETSLNGDIQVNLTQNSSGDFYSDAACTQIQSTFTISSGQSIASAWFKQNAPGTTQLDVTSGSLIAGTLSLNMLAAPVTALSLTGSASISAYSCATYTLTSIDAQSQPLAPSTQLSVSLTGEGTLGSFYSDSGCSTSITTINIPAGQSSVSLYYRKTSTGSVSFSATSSGLTDGALNVTITAALASKLTLAGATTLTTVDCSPYVITSRDPGNVSTAVSANTNIALSGAGSGGSFYSNNTCTTSTNNVTLSQGSTTLTVYYKQTSVGSAGLAVNATQFDGDTKNVTTSLAPPSLISFAGNSTATTVDCTALSVSTRDADLVLANVGSNTTINLSGAGTNGAYYSDAACSSTLNSIVIGTGQSSGNFYYKQTTAASQTLVAAATGLSDGNFSFNVTQAPPDRVILTGPASITTTQCALYTLTARDSALIAAQAPSDITVVLSGQGTGGTFYSDSGCTSSIATATIPTASNTQSIYYKQTTVTAPITLTLAPTGLTGSTLGVTLTAGAATVIALSAPQATYNTTDCVDLTITTKDASNNTVPVTANTTVSLATSNGGTFYSLNTCATTITSTVVSNGTSSKTIYYKKTTTPGAVTLTASSTAKASGTLALTVTAAEASKIAWSTASATIAANACTTYTLTTQDINSNTSAVTGATTVTVGDGAQGGSFFLSTANCTGNTGATNTFNIAAAASTVNVVYKKPAQGSVTLTADANLLTQGTKAVVVSSGLPTQFIVSSGAAVGIVNACISQVIVLRDEQNVTVNAPSPIVMNLGGNDDGTFYSNSGCSTVITSVTYSTGQSSKTVYYKKPTAASVTLTFTDNAALLTAASKGVVVSSGVISKLAYSASVATINKNSCRAYTVQSRDENNQPVVTATNLDFSLSGEVDGSFYSGSTCAGGTEITQHTINAGASTRTVYYMKPTAGNVTLVSSSTGLTSASVAVSVRNIATELRFTSGLASLPINTCGTYVIRSTDNVGTAVNVSPAKTINLSGLSGGASFYLDSTCSYAITSTPMANNTSTITVYVMSPDTGSATLSAAASSLSSGSLGVTFTP